MNDSAIFARPVAWALPMTALATPAAVDFQTALVTANAVIDGAVRVVESADGERPIFFLFGPALYASIEPAPTPGHFHVHYARYLEGGLTAVVDRLAVQGFKDCTAALG